MESIPRDHRATEELPREMRNAEADRYGGAPQSADLLMARAEAEEAEVYPALRRHRNVDEEDVGHSVEELTEGDEALLALLEAGPPGGEEWDGKLEGLVQAVSHHLDEEGRLFIDDTRENVGAASRAQLGRAFAARAGINWRRLGAGWRTYAGSCRRRPRRPEALRRGKGSGRGGKRKRPVGEGTGADGEDRRARPWAKPHPASVRPVFALP